MVEHSQVLPENRRESAEPSANDGVTLPIERTALVYGCRS